MKTFISLFINLYKKHTENQNKLKKMYSNDQTVKSCSLMYE